MTKHNITISLLQELSINYHPFLYVLKNTKYEFISCDFGRTGIIYNKSYDIIPLEYSYNKDKNNIFMMSLIINKSILINNIYISPQSNIKKLNSNQFFQYKNKPIYKKLSIKYIIFCGDFNSRHEAWDCDIRQNEKYRTNIKRGNFIQNIFKTYNIMNDSSKPTFPRKSGDGGSVIDLIFANNKASNIISSIRIIQSFIKVQKFDHYAIQFNINKYANVNLNLNTTHTYFVSKWYKNESCKKQIRTILHEKLHNLIHQIRLKVN